MAAAAMAAPRRVAESGGLRAVGAEAGYAFEQRYKSEFGRGKGDVRA